MSTSVRPEQASDAERIRANVALMRSKGAKDDEVDHYLTNVEGLKPQVAAPPTAGASTGPVDLGAPSTPRIRVPNSPAPVRAESTAAQRRPAASTDVTPGTGAALLSGAAQGATLGFADEALGAVDAANALLPRAMGGESLPLNRVGARYAVGRDKVRAADAAAASAHPVAHVAGELAGGVATAAGSGAVKVGAGFRRAILEGATFGGVAGAGSADGDLADRAKGALAGAASGAVVGGAAHGAARLLKPVASSVADVARLRAPDPAVAGKAPTAIQRVAARVGVAGAPERANSLIRQAIEKGGQSLDDVRSSALAASPDKPVILADIAGEGAQGLAAGARGIPGSGARTTIPNVLKQRIGTQPPRVAADLTNASGEAPIDPFRLAEELRHAKLSEANELYPKGHAHGPVDNPQVLELLKRPYVATAWKDAQKIAAAGGRDLPDLTRTVDKQIVFDGVPLFGPDGAPRTYTTEETVKLPGAQDLHYVKRALDDQITAAYNRGGKNSALAHELSKARDELTHRLYNAVPEYRTADDAYATASRLEDALTAGRAAATQDPRAAQMTLEKLGSNEEKRLFRAGMQDSQLTSMAKANDAGAILPRDPSDVWRKQRIRQISTDSRAGGEAVRRADEERMMIDTNKRILTGSNTAEKSSAQAEISGAGSSHAVAAAAMGHPVAAVKLGFKSYLANVKSGLAGDNADAIAQRLMSGAKTRQELLDAIEQLRTTSTPRVGGQRHLLRKVSEILAGTVSGEVAGAPQ